MKTKHERAIGMAMAIAVMLWVVGVLLSLSVTGLIIFALYRVITKFLM